MTRREPKHRQGSSRNSVPRARNRTRLRNQIKLLCSEIAREFHPDRIVLFGSHASGMAHPESDIDLLVVMPFEGSPFRQASLILTHVVQAIGVLPLDLLVRTDRQVEERIKLGDSFMREIIERGRVMYESDHP